ncbi:vinexin isoform X19 [Drosophila bipectinata]|uniref:vinexin isoform X19 n=1 Tax=Drosophila bipectinata TaxID=42026 RepID=UPI001C8A0649|nr:sorbin and SH3 domain-containing protein 1 isoform X22 [Drosophila bipectinata]
MGQEHTQNTGGNATTFAPKFKARAPPGSGVWTPYGSSNELNQSGAPSATPPPPPLPAQPVWTPQPSPALSGRKEFRPVHFESPTLPRRYTALQHQQQQQQTTTTPPWSYTNGEAPPPPAPPSLNSVNSNSDYAETDCSLHFGPVAPSRSVSDKIRTFERSASNSELQRPFVRRQASDVGRPAYRPNEVIYKVKSEYLSEPETGNDRPRKMAQLGRRQYDGIGPVTNDGMPIILRSEVQEPHQHEWYKRLYQTIHKQKNGDDFVIRYKCPRARPSYKSNGYVSEPEPNYDSDYSTTVRYRTQNPHRVQSVSSAVNVRNLNQDEKLYGTMPNPIKSAQNSYKNQPGRIEDYTTGHSSVSEKEKKEWWDEVMDIFNGNLEQSKLSPLYTEGNLSRALAKESGYTSDSNLVFRKKELPVSSPLSPVEQRQAYKSLQAGGEPPLLGFRKPAPEKPRDLDPNAPPIPPQPPVKGLSTYDIPYNSDTVDGTDVNIHFKTPIRHEQRQNIPEDELAIRQAEHMQKLYQEERRRKYLQELQDMNSRRHTDNFTPSQKSPIALNRYDDFPTDVTLKSLVGPKTVARALFNFQGQSSKELSFRKGDTIYIRRQIDPNWYEGEHNAMIGLLPVSYVEVVSRDGARTPSKRPSEGQARAKYNFQAQSGIELSLNKGELVTLTRRVDGNWFEGKIANRKGIFPVSYVEVLTDIGAEDIAARTTVISSQSTTNLRPTLDALRTNINNEFNTLTQNGSQPPNGILKETRTLQKTDALHVDTSSEPLAYRALYKYRPQNSDELELLEGDVVHVLEKCDDGWFVGTSQRTGCFGTFPGNYVERA